MASGDTVLGAVNIQKVQDDVLKLWSVVKALPEISSDQKSRIRSLYEVVRSLNNPDSNPRPTPRAVHPPSSFDHKLLVPVRSPHSPLI
jgi:fatty acid synthase subunit alpha